MLNIGESYIVREDGFSRLCADLTIKNRRTTLWFGVDSAQEEYLALGRADPFVMAALPSAMRDGHEIVCEDPMSERLHHQLSNGLIPALSFAGALYHLIKITAPLTTKQVPNQGVVGTGFTGGVDSLYTVIKHGADSEFPLTHIAIFHHQKVYSRPSFVKDCREGDRFARELGLKQVYLDTNLGQVFSERYRKVYTFRNLACALALQRLFSVYLVSSGHSVSELKSVLADLEDREKASSHYDPLTISCASTESIAFYLSGGETVRAEKLEALTDWEPSWRWLHPCLRTSLGNLNCGQCKKCSCDLTVLYALGKLDRYRSVFDVDDYLRHYPRQIGRLLTYEKSQISRRALQMLKERDIQIPDYSFALAKQIKKARERWVEILERGVGNEQ